MPDRTEYQVYVQVPNLHRKGLRGRLLATRDSYSEVGDLADYLISSMVDSGISPEQATSWIQLYLDVRKVEHETIMGTPEHLPLHLGH
jgi:hypothetical protein